MKIDQIYTGCLAQGAYYIESNGEAAIIDPLRDPAPYIAQAEADGSKIKYIFETHFHADFVSGHLDLAEKTGAQIIYGPGADTEYDKYEAKDGEEFQLGGVTIKVLHTPGHTPESTTYLLRDEDGKDHAIFTGDSLFIGDVGWPDLAQKEGHVSAEDLAGWLYDSLHHKIMPLADEVIVYPAHGAGSACGKNMSKETWDTLGNQKATNYALDTSLTKEQFIQKLTDGLMPPPQYFAKNAKLNKTGYESMETVMERGASALAPDAFEEQANATGALLLDVRSKAEFVAGFVPNSIFIGLDGSFAPWVGALIPDLMQPILIIAPEGKEEETVMRLARVGYDNAIGYLDGGFDAWKAAGKEVDHLDIVNVGELEQQLQNGMAPQVVDVRKPSEYESEHVDGATNLPLDFINAEMSKVDRDGKYLLHCKTGYRATIAASILKARGYEHLAALHGDFEDVIAAEGIKTTDFVCPTTKA